ncbi:hypothetical protein BHM03_00047539 [Ensete ventricosum]|uniref:RRM domain-containing protein n=1 Tax=Ensete ventricosum TaxID=4639 RepID=A0A445ML94_ENSVE|nr:hypothetical protein BHM03_00047539 [Ensete ventricosum]
MFGFVTFVYPETVKLILAKGNPHFVCDSRVLVKPYKEKGKVPDKKLQQQQQHAERGEFSACTTPTALDARDAYDHLQQLGWIPHYHSCFLIASSSSLFWLMVTEVLFYGCHNRSKDVVQRRQPGASAEKEDRGAASASSGAAAGHRAAREAIHGPPPSRPQQQRPLLLSPSLHQLPHHRSHPIYL